MGVEEDPKYIKFDNSNHIWFRTGEYGEQCKFMGYIDYFRYNTGNHNGPECSHCGWKECWHCEPEPGECSK